MSVLVLVVSRGPQAGASLIVGTTPQRIGRSRGSDLVLTDRGVSRTHLEASVVGGRLHVRCVDGAAPFVVGGREHREATLDPGDTFVVSDTAFGVAPPANAAAAEGHSAQATELRGLLQGLAADVKSLRSIADLVNALDAAEDEAAVAQALGGWARVHAGATGLRLLDAAALAADAELAPLATSQGAVLTLGRAGAIEVAVAAHGAAAWAFVAAVPAPSDELLRLLGVAGRIVGSALARAGRQRNLEEEILTLRRLAVGSARDFVGTSPAAREVSRLLERLAKSDATALLLGESGTGKSFVARLIHEASKRAREPFRVINCAAIPESLLESELFGHERGAFSGAVAAHAGAFEAAGRGTILLDEIGELALPSQAKLLRVLEERRFERVGSNRTQAVEARVLAATNRDLSAMVGRGEFRQDLFFRVSVVSVRIPPLRERGDDVVLLAQRILGDGAAGAGRRIVGFGADAIAAIRGYPWPGNVRELRNAIEHALVLGDTSSILPGDLPETVRLSAAAPAARSGDGDVVALPARLDWLEARAIEAALRAAGGNRTKASALLGINRVTLYKKLKET